MPPRYTASGKRIVHRKPRFDVPQELISAINAGARKVQDLRRDRDNLRDNARRLEHGAYETGFAADTAADPGLRKALNDQAAQYQQEAGAARVKLGRAERSLNELEAALRGLHAEARAWQAGEREED